MNDLLKQVDQPRSQAYNKLIPLTQGKFAIVDAEDFEWLNQWKWTAAKSSSAFYALRADKKLGHKFCYMHRVIMNAKTGQFVDHINGISLDNRRSNLRLCTHKENMHNRKLYSTNTTGYKGVHYYKSRDKYTATINPDGRSVCLGYFNTAIEAAKAYDRAAVFCFGRFASLNFPIH